MANEGLSDVRSKKSVHVDQLCNIISLTDERVFHKNWVHTRRVVAQQASDMRDRVAETHHILVIKLEGTLTHLALKFVHKGDVTFVVPVLYKASEERPVLKVSCPISAPSAASLCLALTNQNFR